MKIHLKRRIRDNLHGTIDISFLEDQVINHSMFQRLRRIHQTAFLSLVFPGATHTRFEHSLGVMHLASLAFGKLKDNQERLIESLKKFESFEAEELSEDHLEGLIGPTINAVEDIFASTYVFQALRLAAMLHDVGHPPFSHSGELFLPLLRELDFSDMPLYIKDYVTKLLEKDPLKKAKHEIFSALIIHKILEDVYKDYHSPNLEKIDPQDIVSIIIPDIPCKAGSPLQTLGIKELCNQLISGEVDVDRIDYLLRDSKECGVIYGIFDMDRILDSLIFYKDLKEDKFLLGLRFSGLAAFEDYLRARQSMYIQLYFHKTSVSVEAMLTRFSKHINWHLPISIHEYTRIDEYSIYDILKKQLNKEDQEGLTLLDDFMLQRKLWKRAFEVTQYDSDEPSKEIDRIKTLFLKHGLDFEEITSQNCLANFDNKDRHPRLRMVKKNSKLFPKICALAPLSSISKQSKNIKITRLYVKPNEIARAEQIIISQEKF